MTGGLYCEWCEYEFFGSDDANEYKGITLCKKCVEWFEENDGHTGKLVIEKCKECGKIKDWKFQKYKKRGRPFGSKNRLKIPSTTLDRFKIEV